MTIKPILSKARLGFILAQILLSEIRFVSWPNHSITCLNMGECLVRPEMVAGVIRVDLPDPGKKDGSGNIHFSTNLIK